MGSLGSFALGSVVFTTLTPVRVESGIVDCVEGTTCVGAYTRCWTLLGWQDALGPASCSAWAAFAVGLAVGLGARALGLWRARQSR